MAADLSSLFRAANTSGTGQITPSELQSALSSGGFARPFSARSVKLLIRIFDMDCNGSINFSEFQQLWGYLTQWRQVFDVRTHPCS